MPAAPSGSGRASPAPRPQAPRILPSPERLRKDGRETVPQTPEGSGASAEAGTPATAWPAPAPRGPGAWSVRCVGRYTTRSVQDQPPKRSNGRARCPGSVQRLFKRRWREVRCPRSTRSLLGVWSKNSNALFLQCLRANHSQLLALQSTVL
jgi:hypothetical protein